MASDGGGDYDANASQEWDEYYPTSSEEYSSSWYPELDSEPVYQQYPQAQRRYQTSGVVGASAQQAAADKFQWASQTGQAATVRAPLRPAAPRPRFGQLALRQPLRPQQGAVTSYAKAALRQQLHMVSKASTADHPSTVSRYQDYYEAETEDYGQAKLHAYAPVARGPPPVTIRPRIAIAASASQPRLASRPRGQPGTMGWPAARFTSPRMRPALNRPPLSAYGVGVRGAAQAGRPVAPGVRAAGLGARVTLAPRGTVLQTRGMPAARGLGATVRTVGPGPRGAQAPRAVTSSVSPTQSLTGVGVRHPTSREPSAFESRLTRMAENSCDDLGISETKDCLATEDGDKTNSKSEACAVNAEEEEKEDEEEEEEDTNCCKICDIKFAKSQAYHVHIRSTSHHQKVEANKREKKQLTGTSQTLPSSVSSVSPRTTPQLQPSSSEGTKKGEHFCYVCNFLFSNAEMFNSHLTGMLHVRRLEEQRTEKPSTVDEEEADEDSQDSVTVTAFKKNDWMSVSEKDLNPDDVGKPGSAQFMCEICNISCTGKKSYEMHIVGSKHLKKLKKTKEIEEFEKMKKEGGVMVEDLQKTKKKRKVLRAQEILDQCSEPLIGLDYMTEFQMEDVTVEPRYICDLCQCKMDMRQVVPHVTGIKHRQKYFKYHSVQDFNFLWNIRRKSEKVKAATKIAKETEAREGRHKLRLKVQLKPFEAGDGKAKDSEEWLEVEDAHSRPKSSLPGLGGFDERSAHYKDVREYEEEEEESEKDEGPILDVDELSRINPPLPVGRGRSRGATYQPPPPNRFRPGAPVSRPPRPPPRGPPPPGLPRYQYPTQEIASRFPAARGYPPEQRRAQMVPPRDPYYQHYPAYSQSRYDYYYSTPSSSSSSSSLGTRAVINYDHQSLTKDDEGCGTRSYQEGSQEGSGARHESGPADRYDRRAADYEGERRASVEKSRSSAASDGDSTISSISIDLVKAAIAQCNIDTEADAEIALQISNSLTQALLEYRLNSLAKAGKTDPALEQHLKNLREQNAEHLTTGHHPETSNLMYSALRATRALAAKLLDGDQETIKQAMSVLDSVNLQLYGMLDKGGNDANSNDTRKRQEAATLQQTDRELHTDRFEHRDEGTSGGYRHMGDVATIRPPSKRFRFGL